MKVLLLFVGNTRFDSRSQKYLAALESLPVQVSVCELSQAQSSLPFLIKWPLFLIKSILFRLFNSYSLVICLDVFSIPATFLLKKPLVFDARELNDRVHAVQHSPFKAKFSAFLESTGFKNAHLVTTVNDYLANSFKNRYQVDCLILLNLPFSTPAFSQQESRKKLELPENLFLWVFQGNLQHGRGVETALDFMKNRPEDEGLLFIGPDLAGYQAMVGLSKLPRIFFTGQVPAPDVLNYTVAGNAGLMFIETSSESYLNSLPNKFFEYVTAQLPVLTTRLPQVEKYLDKFNCGLAADLPEIHQKADFLKIHSSVLSHGCKKLLSEINGSDQIRFLSNQLGKLLT